MSGDEIAVGIAAGLVAALFWGGWLYSAFRTSALVHPARRRAALLGVVLVAMGIVAVALVTGADPVVRTSPGYVLLFLAVAAATLAVATVAASTFGIGPLDQVIREQNLAAGGAVGGLWLGTGLVNAGANVGRGDTIYTTLGPLTLALAALVGLTGILAAATDGFRSVRLDRDDPAGLRLGGLFVALGAILGLAAAGDYESAPATWIDFGRYGWPVLVLLLVAILVERRLRPTVERPCPSRVAGLFPAAAYLCAAAAWVLFCGTGFQPVRMNQ